VGHNIIESRSAKNNNNDYENDNKFVHKFDENKTQFTNNALNKLYLIVCSFVKQHRKYNC